MENFRCSGFLNRNIPLYCDILNAFRRMDYSVLYDSSSAVLIRQNNTSLYAAASEKEEEMKRILKLLPDTCTLIVHGSRNIEIAQETAFTGTEKCYQVVYAGSGKFDLTGKLTIRNPDRADFPKFSATYGLLKSEKMMDEFLRPDFFGAYLGNEMVGYMGIHSEGSMGMLHIFEPFRKKGYAEELQKFMINYQLDRGYYPYGQVFVSNTASMGLQKKLGMTVADDYICWTRRE